MFGMIGVEQYQIRQDSSLFNNYLGNLISRTYKILPLLEENNFGVHKYIDSLSFELSGILNVVQDLEVDSRFLSIVGTIEEIGDEIIFDNYNFELVRREILKCTNLLNTMLE